MKSIFSHERFGEKVKVELDLSYGTKADLKKATGFHPSKTSSKIILSLFKSSNYKLDVDKLKTVPVDLSKLSNV